MGEKATCQLIRFSKERRISGAIRGSAQSSIRRRQVHNVEDVVCKRAQRNAVAAVDPRSLVVRTAAGSSQTHPRHSVPASTTSTRPTTAAPSDGSFAFFHLGSNAKALGYAQIHRKLNRTVSIINRNQMRPSRGSRADIKISVLRGIDGGWIGKRGGKCRAIIKERIAINILAQLDIERRPRGRAGKRADPETERRRVIGKRKPPIADVEELPPVILHDVVLIRRMIAGTTRVAIGLAVNIKPGKRKFTAVRHIQIEKNLVLFEYRQRIVLVDVACLTLRAQSQRWARAIRQRSIDVAR